MRTIRHLVGAAVIVALIAAPVEAKKVNVKLATLAPDGSSWHELLQDLAAEWDDISDGQVRLRIFAGGVAGDEPAVMKKLGINNYHAALITSHGLSSISRSTRVFSIPFMLRDDNEVELAMEALSEDLEAKLADRGYIVLTWAFAGWVNFFVPNPDASVEAVRKLRLFTWAGDPETAELWDMAGFTVVPLPATDLLTGLKTNLIDAFDTTPIYALSSQAFRQTDYMIDMSWAPITGALVVNKKTWEKIPEELRPRLMASARAFGVKLHEQTRQMEAEAVESMRKRGLTVVTPTPAQIEEWKELVFEAYPKIRGKYVEAEDFDRLAEVMKKIRGES
jgi:TRAP-type C4-dicarboxylate transport system substrate-binding protein